VYLLCYRIEFCLFMIVLFLKYYCFCGNISKRNRNCLVTGGCNMKGAKCLCTVFLYCYVCCSVLCECVTHWEKSREYFGKILYFSQTFPIFFLKMGTILPILREKIGENTKCSRNFPMIFPSACT